MLGSLKLVQASMLAVLVGLVGLAVKQQGEISYYQNRVDALQTRLTASSIAQERADARLMAQIRGLQNQLFQEEAALNVFRLAMNTGFKDDLKQLPANDYHRTVDWDGVVK